MHGVLGAAAAKHVEVGFSSDSGSAKGLSSAVSPALVKRGSTSGAMKGDALVSDPSVLTKQHKLGYKKKIFPNTWTHIFRAP